MQPPLGSPAGELAESSEEWSERIVDPQRLNLDFVALSWGRQHGVLAILWWMRRRFAAEL